MEELDNLRRRVDQLEETVCEFRERLTHCLHVSARPKDALALARGVAETLTKRMLEDIGLKPSSFLDKCLKDLEEPEVMSRGLVPAEIITLLHMIRVLGNKATHDAMRIEVTGTDVDLVLRSVLRVVEWYFAEFERGPRVDPLFRPGAPPPPLRTDQPPPAVRMPALTIIGPSSAGDRRKVFVSTERLLGFGRERTSRDPRVHIVTRLLPCQRPADANWNANLENISQFHAQLWWQMNRVEIRDENSDKRVFLDGVPIARGVWTPCSLPRPAHIRLGEAGVEFTLTEIIRTVENCHVSCVRLVRVGNWPLHEYLLVSRPMITIGSDLNSLAFFPGIEPTAAIIVASERGWTVRRAGKEEQRLGPGESLVVADPEVRISHCSDGDFLD